MDINTQNSSGMMNGMPPVTKNEKKIGPIVGVLIIVLILIIAALYFFGQRLNTESTGQNTQIQPTTSATAVTTADDVPTLQSDLDMQMKDVDYSF